MAPKRKKRKSDGDDEQSASQAKIAAIFRQWDADGNGTISREELASVMHQLGLLEDEVDRLLDEMDKNADADSAVDYEEFISWMYEGMAEPARLPPPGGVGATPGSPGELLRGVSVQHLHEALPAEMAAAEISVDACVYEIEECVIRKKGQDIMCPRDGRQGSAYVDALNGEDCAGTSTVMLSYTWGYRVIDIIEALVSHCRRCSQNPKRVYVWICCLCVNQHRVHESKSSGVNVSFDEFSDVFGSRVRSIGHILALMEPWSSPKYLQRLWCVYELHTAIDLGEGCRLEIIMPPQEEHSFASALADNKGLDQLWKTLSQVNVESAQASVETDRANILGTIEQNIGFAQINNVVMSKLRSWFIQAAMNQARDFFNGGGATDAADVCGTVSVMLFNLGELAMAKELVHSAIEQLCTAGALGTYSGAILLRRFGVVKWRMGDLTDALVSFDHSERIFRDTDTFSTEEGANLLTNKGVCLENIGKVEQALDCYSKARSIRVSTSSMRTTDGATLVKNLGIAKRRLGDLPGALACFSEARGIRSAIGSLERPDGATLLELMGAVEWGLGSLQAAQESFGEACEIRRRIGMLETPQGARLLRKAAGLMAERGDLHKSLACCVEARRILGLCCSHCGPDNVEIVKLTGDIWRQLGDMSQAMECYVDARSMCENLCVGAANSVAQAEQHAVELLAGVRESIETLHQGS